ncbi:MAG: PKD domain-containing protein [Pedobacter sp.]|nr:MAG: PKD domain-containing protein [Pedobacter sp.]
MDDRETELHSFLADNALNASDVDVVLHAQLLNHTKTTGFKMSNTFSGLRSLILLMAFCACSSSVFGQVTAGIMANGQVIPQGDTVNVCIGNIIRYQSAASGSFVMSWRFNSGTPSTGSGIGPFNVLYNTVGYDTTFQRVDGASGFADSTFIIVRVSDTKPTAQYSFAPNNQCGNVPVLFTNSSTGIAPLSYYWDFADNQSSTLQDPSHSFLTAVGSTGSQTFNVKLVVANPNACKDSITYPVTVLRTPDATIGNANPNVLFGTFNGVSTFRHCQTLPAYGFQFLNTSSTLASGIHTSYTIKCFTRTFNK